MKIKKKEESPLLPQMMRDFLRNRKSLTAGVLGFAGILLVGVLFFAVLGYGAYLKKVGDTTYYKHALLRIADLDFSFVKNFAQGRLQDFDEIKIDIKFKHMLRLQYLREQALKEGIISEAIKNEEFPATLTYNGASYDVKIGLAGMMPIHVSDPVKWSLQVKVKGDNTIQGMKRFGLLLPSTRGYLTDWLGMELLKERGLMGMRVDFVDVSLNGKSMGIYYMEERFDKYLVESNELREGIIFQMEDGVSAYQESKLMEVPAFRDQLLLVKRMWQDVTAGNLAPENFFDMKKMASLFAVTDLMNNKHALYRTNLRFYFNPVTGLAEPIAREWGSLTKNDPSALSLFIEEPKVASRHAKLAEDPVLRMIYDNLEFKGHYIREAEALSEPKLLDQLLTKNGEKLNKLVSKVYRTWPFYELPTHALYENQYYIKGVLFPDVSQVSAYLQDQDGEYIDVYLKNLQDMPLEVTQISWRDSIFYTPERPVVLESKSKDQVAAYRFRIPTEHPWADSLAQELKVSYHLYGLPTSKRSALVFPWTYDKRGEYAFNPVAQEANHRTFDFIVDDEEKNEIRIPAGKWTIDRDLIIPADRRFVAAPGAQVDLINEARILSYSSFFCEGTEEQPILFHSSDSTSHGILIIRGRQRSIVRHTTFDRLSCPREDGWTIPGALTFFESPVDFENCTFSNNKIGDDMVNVVRTNFTMDQVQFKNINADAFDCDFCKGSVTNSSFVNTGNDAIDVSGTEIEVSHVFLNYIGDKGLSAGEGSTMTARFIEVYNSEIGACSKDRSNLMLYDSKMVKARIGITLFEKKSEFGPAFTTAERVDIQEAEIPYLIETNSSLVLDGQPYLANRANVKDILYGAEYGKASR